jgi:hypothetical protein
MSAEKKNLFTYTGQVHEIGPVQNFNSGFRKRELICKTKNGEYTDYAVFTAKKDIADKLALLKPGDAVKVVFVLDGHEWEGPKGKRWFGGLSALKVDPDGIVGDLTPSLVDSTEQAVESDPADLPF